MRLSKPLFYLLSFLVGLAVIAEIFYPGITGSGKALEATLLATLMQNFRSEYTANFDRNELRESMYGALRYFQEDSAPDRAIFDAETRDNIMRSYNNSVVVPVLDAQVIASTTPYTRTCVITDAENDSALVTLTFASYGFAFSMTPATHYSNDVKYQEDFDRKVRKFLIQWADDLDNLCIAQLEADKNAFWTNIAPDFYAEVADALQVPLASQEDYYNQLESIHAVADFYDDISVITSTGGMPLVRRQEAQGSQNATNEGFQMDLRSYRWYQTNRIGNAAGVGSTQYSVGRGTCYIGNRNDADAVQGNRINDVSVWGQEQTPIINFNVGTYFTQDCGDRSAIAGAATAGNTRSLFQGFEWSSDFVVATAYNSDQATRYQPIFKAELLTT